MSCCALLFGVLRAPPPQLAPSRASRCPCRRRRAARRPRCCCSSTSWLAVPKSKVSASKKRIRNANRTLKLLKNWQMCKVQQAQADAPHVRRDALRRTRRGDRAARAAAARAPDAPRRRARGRPTTGHATCARARPSPRSARARTESCARARAGRGRARAVSPIARRRARLVADADEPEDEERDGQREEEPLDADDVLGHVERDEHEQRVQLELGRVDLRGGGEGDGAGGGEGGPRRPLPERRRSALRAPSLAPLTCG